MNAQLQTNRPVDPPQAKVESLQARIRPAWTRILVLGGTHVVSTYRLYSRSSGRSGQIVGFVLGDAHGSLRFRSTQGEQAIESLESLLDSHALDEVLQIEPCPGIDSSQLSHDCAVRGITFRTLIRSPLGSIGRYTAERLANGDYLLSFQTVPDGRMGLALKRLIDIAGALLGLLACVVVGLLCMLRVRRETSGSLLFRQTRVGHNGRFFDLYKFRTMHVTAEENLKHLAAFNEMNGHVFKMRSDPRVTPFGRFLRRHYLDELPQFWNVLKGEMSLVGTRPPTRDEVKNYSPHHQRRLSMKPGMTGLWQLRGINEVNDFEEIVRLDCSYIDNWSLWRDFKIIGETILKFCRGDGY